ncbi:MAG: DsbA family protein [Candidatus Wildermuthbacteria bacterium]|nr:DsbA family protein [Candidatus Wildermuthbacteria bacterium]
MENYKSLFVPASILGAGVIIAVAVFATGGLNIPAQQGLSAQTGGDLPEDNKVASLVPTVSAGDYIRGNPSAPITIIEYSDFQCPFCRQFHPSIVQALGEYGDQVRWVYRHFPLDQIHSEARPAAEAAECVGEQKGSEGFWQFADAMFANQQRLGNALYREVAEQAGVNMAQFDACVSAHTYANKVEAQLQEGVGFGITGTPGSFVNNTPIRGALPYANLKAIIDAELGKL